MWFIPFSGNGFQKFVNNGFFHLLNVASFLLEKSYIALLYLISVHVYIFDLHPCIYNWIKYLYAI